MDYNFSDLKKKKVINVTDGKDLGKIIDFIFSYPDGKIKSIIVPGKKNAFFTGCELIINFSCIERIGDDTILVSLCRDRAVCNQCEDFEE
jgi:YlmC/YmxH family sporulation protein